MRTRPTLVAGVLAVAFLGTTSQAPAASTSKSKTGGSITLKGIRGEKVRVRVLSVIDPVAPVDDFSEAPEGTRYVGVRIKMTNVGRKTYSDSPSNGAKLIVSGSEQVGSTLLGAGPCSSEFGSSVKLSKGSTRIGCIPFEVPTGKRARTFQLTLSSGFAEQTGEWKLR